MKKINANYELLNVKDVTGEPVGDIRVMHTNQLKPFTIEGDLIPKLIDEIPIITLAACFCHGESHINNASELRVKETDRLKVITRQLIKMGANIIERPDGLTINGVKSLKGAIMDSETDHRIAMTLGIAAIIAEGNSTIIRSDAASVSYPNFWKDLEKIRT